MPRAVPGTAAFGADVPKGVCNVHHGAALSRLGVLWHRIGPVGSKALQAGAESGAAGAERGRLAGVSTAWGQRAGGVGRVVLSVRRKAAEQ